MRLKLLAALLFASIIAVAFASNTTANTTTICGEGQICVSRNVTITSQTTIGQIVNLIISAVNDFIAFIRYIIHSV